MVALLNFSGGVQNFTVRTNPNYIIWSYNLRTKVFNTYGGRVIQILGVNYGPLSIEIESGMGGMNYFLSVIDWFRRTSLWQRDNNQPIRMTYPERNYVMDVYLQSITIRDDLQNVLRPLQINMAIDLDFSGILSGELMSEELRRLAEGIGYEDSAYNDPLFGSTPSDGVTSNGNDVVSASDVESAIGGAIGRSQK